MSAATAYRCPSSLPASPGARDQPYSWDLKQWLFIIGFYESRHFILDSSWSSVSDSSKAETAISLLFP